MTSPSEANRTQDQVSVEPGAYGQQVIKVAGHSFEFLAFEPGRHRCGDIEDGVAFAHWMVQSPNRYQAEGSWVIRFADLEAIYLAAKKERENGDE